MRKFTIAAVAVLAIAGDVSMFQARIVVDQQLHRDVALEEVLGIQGAEQHAVLDQRLCLFAQAAA